LRDNKDNRRRALPIMYSVLWLITTIINIYTWIIILQVVLSWLIAFNVVNTSNRFVYMVGDFLYRATEPALRPIRRYVPTFGGLDISPIILLLFIFLIREVIRLYVRPYVF
jgi:YggT family protein